MSDTLNVRVSISDPTDSTPRAVAAEIVNDAKPASHHRELLKAHYSEGMNAYRYFGTLRAQIAWAPAIILVAIITLVVKDTGILETFIFRFILPGAIFIVFIAIYVANHYLQLQQIKCSNVAKSAEHYWIHDKAPDKISFFDLREQKKEIPRTKKGKRPDIPSWCLIVFLVLLWILHFLAIMYSVGGWHAYWEGEAVSQEAESGPSRPASNGDEPVDAPDPAVEPETEE